MAYSAPSVPKTFFNSSPLTWLTLLSCLFWGVITSNVFATEPGVTGVGHTPGGKVAFNLDPNPSRYHILQRSRELSEVGRGRPVAMVRGSSRPGMIADSTRPKDQGYYQLTHVESAAPRDTDRDGFSDWLELARPGYYNPLNPATPVERAQGSVMLVNRTHFEQLAARDDRPGAQSVREIKFLVYDVHTSRPVLYFANSNRYRYHFDFTSQVVNRYNDLGLFNSETYFDNTRRKNLAGSLIAHDNYVDAEGRRGLYTVEFWPTDPVAFRFVEKGYELVSAAMPFVDGNIAYHPASETQRRWYNDEKEDYEKSYIQVVQTEDLYANVVYTGLNPGEGYGRLRVVNGSETLSVRDIVIFRNIPNDLTHVAGIITEIPQTPLSHINLKAKQNNTPNAFIKDASTHPEIAPFIDQNIYYRVTADGFEIRSATEEEVEAWFEAIRPANPQVPQRDLSITEIRPLSRIQFNNSDAFGAKAANVAELRRIIPRNAPNGYAIPFYFYDEFMKAGDLYSEAQAMMEQPLFRNSALFRDALLKSFRQKIKDAPLPAWMFDAVGALQESIGPDTTLRLRSSTNNEDLEGFNGAGLYSSFTHYLDEGHLEKTVKQVWASLWNYRAFEEREFWRIDHFSAAMGVLVHPNYENEQANGVGVTTNIFDPRWEGHYVNVQIGENLVTNPEAGSIPEEYLIARLAGFSDEIQYIRFSNQLPDNQTVLTRSQALDLKAKMNLVHSHFLSRYNPPDPSTWAMEVEFKITEEGNLLIKQARPWIF